MRNQEDGEKPFLNSSSSLPASKRKLKESIKDRIRLLCGAYISLASFVPDDDTELFLNDKGSKKKKMTVLKRVLQDMEKNINEIETFRPLEF